MAVQTETYANIVARVEALIGDDLTTTELARLKAIINRRARWAFKRYDNWPSFFVAKGQRRVNGDKGIEHVHIDHNGDDTGLPLIDEIFRVWQKEPFVDGGSQETLNAYDSDDVTYPVGYDNTYDTTVDNDHISLDLLGVTQKSGLTIITTNSGNGVKVGDVVKLKGTTPPAGFPDLNTELTVSLVSSTTLFQATNTWTGGTGVYTVTDGTLQIPQAWISYRKRLPAAYGDGGGETSTVPHEWAEYLVQAAYADFLRADGQTDKAKAEEGFAHEVLQEEMWRHDRKQSKHEIISKIRTHSTENCR